MKKTRGRPPSEPITSFGRRIRKARGNKTPDEIAELAGVDDRHYRKIEQGKSEPSLSVFVRLCRVLGRSPSWMLQDYEEKE